MATGSSSTAYREYQEYVNYPEVMRRQMEVLPGGKIARKRRLRRDRLAVCLVSVCLLAFCFTYLLLAAKIGMTNGQINSVQRQIAETQNDIALAEFEYGKLNSLARIQAYASDQLGMIKPEAGEVYYLNEKNSAYIAMGLQNGMEQENISALEEDAGDQGLWHSLAMMLDRHFYGEPAAAE
ncbi:MAG: hypothetical protein K6B40_06695 [Firmicutes bacterium]|nr:hypothetical protein [Bacillota bacterium]